MNKAKLLSENSITRSAWHLQLFSESYEESRVKFRGSLEQVRRFWPGAEIRSYPLGRPGEDLAVEVIAAPPLVRRERAILLTAGLHGIEGYVGAAVAGLFIAGFLESLDPADTGLFLVHAINPWGMRQRRRTNENNVDLNRNFIHDWESLDPSFNRGYDRAASFLNPALPAGRGGAVSYGAGLVKQLLAMGLKGFREATLLGQYRHPLGIYYGGGGYEVQARVMMELFREQAAACRRLLMLDMHSGYGPRYQMTIVNSTREPRGSAELQRAFNYPMVAKTGPEEFYATQGDMVDYFYGVVEREFPGLSFYGAIFEFGTLGDSIPAAARSLRAIVDENRLYHHGAVSPAAGRRTREAFDEQFIPRERRWREKALQDASRALSGILGSEGFN